MFLTLRIAILLFLSLLPTAAIAQLQVEFLAAESSWAFKEIGHAFMIISYGVSNGSKEDCYGFYPKEGLGVIAGPGIVSSEFTKDPARLSRVTVSIKRPITETERRTLVKLAEEWNKKEYALATEHCADFIDSAASALGMVTPPRDRLDHPTTFLQRLKNANEPRIVGTWQWLPRNQTVTINADGTCTSSYKVTGTWTLLNAKTRGYRIQWKNGFVDTLTLSESGDSLSGANQNSKHPEPFTKIK